MEKIPDKYLLYQPGMCRCGCGGKTSISKSNNSTNGHVKDQAFKFLPGHHMRVLKNKERAKRNAKNMLGGC